MTITFEPEAFEASIAGVSVKLDPHQFMGSSHAFIYAYGLKQYIQDGAAVAKTVKEGESIRDKTADEIATEKREGVLERVDNVKAGEFTRRNAVAKLSPEEKERAAVTMAQLSTWAKAQEKKLPGRTGKNANAELLDKMLKIWYEKNKDDIEKEVARRMKQASKHLGDVTDLDALFEIAEVAKL